MVAVATDESSVGEGPERVAGILAFLGGQPWTLEDHSVVPFLLVVGDRLDPEASIGCRRKIVVDQLQVVDCLLYTSPSPRDRG